MPLVMGLQEDHLQVELVMFDGFRIFCVLHVLFLLNLIALMSVTCFMGSFPSETEYCGWNEDNSSEA